MREAYGHLIWTVEDLIEELRNFDPTYEIGVNFATVQGYSIKGLQVNLEGIVDIYLQMSSDPVLGFIKYDKVNGRPVFSEEQKKMMDDKADFE